MRRNVADNKEIYQTNETLNKLIPVAWNKYISSETKKLIRQNTEIEENIEKRNIRRRLYQRNPQSRTKINPEQNQILHVLIKS